MTEQKAYIKNLEIYYKIMGERGTLPAGRQALLILHGWGSKSDNWVEAGELISKKGFKVIVPDLPGFGKSNKPPVPWTLDDYCSFVEDLAARLGLKKFYLLGHSFGGAVAVKYALKNPEKVDKMFLAGAACIRRKTFKKKALFVFSKVFKIFGFIPLLKKAFYRFFVKSDYPLTKGLMRKTYLNVIKENLSKDIESVRVQTVIIWGQEDNVVPLKYAKEINSKIKGSQLIVIQGAGHDLERRFPKALAEKISI